MDYIFTILLVNVKIKTSNNNLMTGPIEKTTFVVRDLKQFRGHVTAMKISSKDSMKNKDVI